MKDYEYKKLTKVQLIEKLKETEGTAARQDNTIKRLEREKNQKVNELKGAQSTVKNLMKDLRSAEAKPTPDLAVLEQTIKNQEESIKKLIGYIDEFIGASRDTFTGLKSFVNMSENAFKNIIEDIQKG